MEVVVRRLESTSITPNDGGDNRTHFDALYKNWGRLGNQEERRKEILEVQKSNRNSKLDTFRGILDLVQTVEKQYTYQDDLKVSYRPSIYVAGFNKAPSYNKVLMMSEWLIEKPSDFETNWVVVPSPKGSRTLVVANNGITRLYTKYGHLILQCRTGLPGGSSADPKVKTNCCVLDCFYQKKNNTLYVLDLLAWNSMTMTDGEFEFRDYWLRTQLAELRAIRSINKNNELKFELLPKVSCAKEPLNRFMSQAYFKDEVTNLDGLLFYHKNAHYFSGETPLVGWLFPYMVPEVLGNDITVNRAYMIQKPANYRDQSTFITEFNAKMETKTRKPRGKRHITNQMDTAEVKKEENKCREAYTASEERASMEAAMDAETLEKDIKVKSKELLETMDAEDIADIEKDILSYIPI